MNAIFSEQHLLSWIIAVPFVGIAALAIVPGDHWARRVALACTLVDFGLCLYLWSRFDVNDPGIQFPERVQWMLTFDIYYAVGVDGISILLVLLTTLLMPLCILCSWTSITSHVRAFMMLILLVEGAMLVVFTAQDLFLFFMMWEVTMIPMYFMIILWGGPGRIVAGLKFVLYSLTGSLLLLVGILALYVQGGQTFNMQELGDVNFSSTLQENWIFLAFLLAFGIKLPMFPVHTWLPDAHAEAPTAGSVILAGVLLKMGGYGFLRICLPMFPDASLAFAPYILWLSVVAILYGGYMALAQDDLKKLVAYSSISHMGFVTLGIFVFNRQGIQGAILQMFNHGIVTGAMFLAVGMLYERTHSRLIGDYGGLHKRMPRFVALLCLFSVASFGLPGTCSFIGEFLVLLGTSKNSFTLVLLAMGGIVLAASYILWMLQRVALGQPATRTASVLPDLTLREAATLLPLAAVVLWVGVYPTPLMERMDNCVAKLVSTDEEAASARRSQQESVGAPFGDPHLKMPPPTAQSLRTGQISRHYSVGRPLMPPAARVFPCRAVRRNHEKGVFAPRTIKETSKRLPGSPLIAANSRKPFARILLCEKNRKLANACKERFERMGAEDRSQVYVGECNKKVSQIAAAIPDGALTLAFIDPTGLHAEFKTIETPPQRGRVDLLILFADPMDIIRKSRNGLSENRCFEARRRTWP